MNPSTLPSWRRRLHCALRQRRNDDELLMTLLAFVLCYLLSPR